MNYTPVGRIRPVYKGEWNAETAYTILDMVIDADGLAAYIAQKDVPAGTPLTDAEHWGTIVNAHRGIAGLQSRLIGKAGALEEVESGNPVMVWGDRDSSLSVATGAAAVYRCGRNLINYPYLHSTAEINGVTFTDNNDGSITISGTATATAYFNLCYLLPGIQIGDGVYTIQTARTIGEYTFSTGLEEAVQGVGMTYQGSTNKLLFLRVNADTSVDSLTLRPQVEMGGAAAEYASPLQHIGFAVSDGHASVPALPDGPTVLYTDGEAMTVAYSKSLARAFEDAALYSVQSLTDEQMSQARENIGAVSLELVWENASPESGFAEQTVTLDLSRAKAIFVQAQNNVINGGYLLSYGPFPKDETVIIERNVETYVYTREFTPTDAGVAFLNCNRGANYLVPLKIWAVFE